MKTDFFDLYLNKLEELYSYPKVQIERAISPLISIFITDIINDSLKTKIKLSLPEFPLKKDTNYQSNNIDWLLIDEENYKLYFIEFKTTSSNIKPTQLNIYDNILDKIRKKILFFSLKISETFVLSLKRKLNIILS